MVKVANAIKGENEDPKLIKEQTKKNRNHK